jgi:hypothetical protein
MIAQKRLRKIEEKTLPNFNWLEILSTEAKRSSIVYESNTTRSESYGF